MGKKSRLARISALVLSLITLLGSPYLLIALDGISNLIIPSSTSSEIILSSFYPILIALICLIICKIHPKSIWYTPIICNAYNLIPAILDPNFWAISFSTTSYWTSTPKMWMFHGSFVLSVIGAIVGVAKGQKVNNSANH